MRRRRRRPEGGKSGCDLIDLVSLEDGVLLEVLLVEEAGQPAPEGLAVLVPRAALGLQHLNHHTVDARRCHLELQDFPTVF